MNKIKNGYAKRDSENAAILQSKIKELQEKTKKATPWDLFWNGNKWLEEIDKLKSDMENLSKNAGMNIKNKKTRDEILNAIRQSGLSLSEQYYVATQLGLQNY